MKKGARKKEVDEFFSESQKGVQKKKSSRLISRKQKIKEIGQVINLPKIFSSYMFY
jgi:hypothetical protein